VQWKEVGIDDNAAERRIPCATNVSVLSVISVVVTVSLLRVVFDVDPVSPSFKCCLAITLCIIV